jgi:hypothetical protein
VNGFALRVNMCGILPSMIGVVILNLSAWLRINSVKDLVLN